MASTRYKLAVFGISFLVVAVTLLLVVLIGIVVGTALRMNNMDAAFMAAVDNQNQCNGNPANCLRPNEKPAPPTTFLPSDFSEEIAKFAGQHVSNLEVILNEQADAQGINTSVPGLNEMHFTTTRRKRSNKAAAFFLRLLKKLTGMKEEEAELGLLPGLTLKRAMNTLGHQMPTIGYAAVDHTNAVLYFIFRGTITTSEWRADMAYEQTALPADLFGPAATATPVLVHSGFLDLFSQFLPDLQKALQEHTQTTVVVSGHSLGGALASLVSLYISLKHPERQVHLYTFGKPRVGNEAYAQLLNLTVPLDRIYRIENDNDVIPQLPLSAQPNLGDHQRPWIYQHEGNFVRFNASYGALYPNHSMTAYLIYLYKGG